MCMQSSVAAYHSRRSIGANIHKQNKLMNTFSFIRDMHFGEKSVTFIFRSHAEYNIVCSRCIAFKLLVTARDQNTK